MTPSWRDRDRPLTERGRRAAVAMRQAMHGLGLAPDLVLVSPARRTLQTLDLLEPWDDTPLLEHLERSISASPGANARLSCARFRKRCAACC